MQYSWNSVPGSISFYIITVIWARLGEPYYYQALHSKHHAFHSIHFQRTPQRQVPWWQFDPSPRNIHKFPTGLSYSTLVREQGFSSYHPQTRSANLQVCRRQAVQALHQGGAAGRVQGTGHSTVNCRPMALAGPPSLSVWGPPRLISFGGCFEMVETHPRSMHQNLYAIHLFVLKLWKNLEALVRPISGST